MRPRSRWAYSSVVEMLECPSNSWTARRSAPFRTKWVAYEWRRVWGVVKIGTPACMAAFLTMRSIDLGVRRESLSAFLSRKFINRAFWLACLMSFRISRYFLNIIKPNIHVNHYKYGYNCIEAETVIKNKGKKFLSWIWRACIGCWIVALKNRSASPDRAQKS